MIINKVSSIMSGFFCALSLLPYVVKREFKKYMIHPLASIIKTDVISNPEFYLYNTPYYQDIKPIGPYKYLDDKFHRTHPVTKKLLIRATYMWWNRTKQHSIYEVDKYVIGTENTIGSINTDIERQYTKNLCSATYFHTCNCNGNNRLHDMYLNNALLNYLKNYINKVLNIIDEIYYLYQEGFKSLMCNILGIEDRLIAIKYYIEEVNITSEYYKTLIKEVKELAAPIL